MFFIIDMMPGLKQLGLYKGTCRVCGQYEELELFKTFQCLRLFFIPVFRWHNEYFIKHRCGAVMSLSEEDAIAIMHAGVLPDQVNLKVIAKDRRCTSCGRQLQEDFVCCPYCGHNIP